MVRKPLAMQETQEKGIWSLGQEDVLEEGTATYYSILVWKIPGTEEPGKLQPLGSESQTRLKRLSTQDSTWLKYSLLINFSFPPCSKVFGDYVFRKVLSVIASHTGNHYIVTFIIKLCVLPPCAALSHSVMSNSLWPHELQLARLLCPWIISRQKYWSGLPFPPPGIESLPHPGIELRSPILQADSLQSEPPG